MARGREEGGWGAGVYWVMVVLRASQLATINEGLQKSCRLFR